MSTPFTWTKTKDGGCKAEGYLVTRHQDKGDIWRLEHAGLVLATGSRDVCKAHALRHRKKPPPAIGAPGTTIGNTKTVNETGGEWLLRMAREHGYCPSWLIRFPAVCRDAGIEAENYDAEELKQLDREAFPLAQQWAKEYNSRPDRRGCVMVTYNSWFAVPGETVQAADRRYLQALAATNKADVPEVVKEAVPARAPKEPKAPAGKDAWGFRVGSGAAEINAGVSTDWKTADKIAKDSGTARSVHGHLKHLETKGLLEVRGEGRAREYRWVPPADEQPKKKVVLKKKPV